MALFVNGVGTRVLLLLLLLTLVSAEADLEMDNQDIKMVTEDIIGNEGLQTGLQQTVQFDHYILELGWPPSICREQRFLNKCRTPWPARFVIHGLWPSNQNRPAPEFCTGGEEFSLVEINKLRKDLNQNWPSLFKDQSNDQFWKYQWDKHGRCSNLGLADYFKAALRLHKGLKLSDKLKAIGVTPGKNYNPNTVVDNYGKKNNGIKPKIKCGRKTATPLAELMDKFNFKVKLNLKTYQTMPSPNTNCQLTSVEFPK